MIRVNIKCPYCKKLLMNKNNKIEDYPSVEVAIKYGKKRSKLYLSSLYGSQNIKGKFNVPKGKIVQFFCPRCNSDLTSSEKCGKCGAPMIELNLAQGGMIKLCSRRGCKKHFIEFENLDTELKAFYNTYSSIFCK